MVKPEFTENKKSAKFMYISGIPTKFTKSEDDQKRIVQTLCKKLRIVVAAKEIEKIYKNGTNVIVRFNGMEMRDKFIEIANGTEIRTNEVCDDEKPKLIHFGKYIVPGLSKAD